MVFIGKTQKKRFFCPNRNTHLETNFCKCFCFFKWQFFPQWYQKLFNRKKTFILDENCSSKDSCFFSTMQPWKQTELILKQKTRSIRSFRCFNNFKSVWLSLSFEIFWLRYTIICNLSVSVLKFRHIFLRPLYFVTFKKRFFTGLLFQCIATIAFWLQLV